MTFSSKPTLLLCATLVLLLSGLAVLWPAAPAAVSAAPAAQGSQLGQGWMCVTAPTQIERGNTEPIMVDLELAETPSGDNTDRICQPVEIYESMGVGIAGIALNNFQIDPPESRIGDRIDPAGVNNFTWIVNATGEEGSRHNLIVFAFIDDAARSTGFRSIARVPLRIAIDAPPKSIGQSVLAFLNSIKEVLVVVGGLLAAGLAMRSQVRKIRARDDGSAGGS